MDALLPTKRLVSGSNWDPVVNLDDAQGAPVVAWQAEGEVRRQPVVADAFLGALTPREGWLERGWRSPT